MFRFAIAAASPLLALFMSHSVSFGASLEDLSGLLGTWKRESERSVTEESWHRIGDHTWEGQGVRRSKADQSVGFTEDLRLLEMKGEVFYLAKVSENELPVAFKLVEATDSRFTFENPAHDFPQRLVYELGDDTMTVIAETLPSDDPSSEGQRLTFAFVRVK